MDSNIYMDMLIRTEEGRSLVRAILCALEARYCEIVVVHAPVDLGVMPDFRWSASYFENYL